MIEQKSVENLIKELAEIGKTSTGTTRLAYSWEENAAHEFVRKFMETEGFQSAKDSAGNLLIGDVENPAILIGSHLDTVPNGGNYDGAAGIVAGMEVLQQLKQIGKGNGVCLIVFRAEESSRFGKAHIGSTAFCSGLDEKTLALSDGKDTLKEAIEACGFKPDDLKKAYPSLGKVKAYFELHIEQGDVLADKKLPIGIVDGIAGFTRYEMIFHGKADHSGTTPMEKRADAVCAQAECTLFLEKISREAGKEAAYVVGTIGYVETPGGSVNQVSGLSKIGVDIRSADLDAMIKFREELLSGAEEICAKRNIKLEAVEKDLKEPTRMDDKLTAMLEKTAQDMGISEKTLKMPSMAGHDAMSLAKVGVPSAMLFVQSTGGSHNPAENASCEDITLSAEILTETIAAGIPMP